MSMSSSSTPRCGTAAVPTGMSADSCVRVGVIRTLRDLSASDVDR